MKMEQIEKVLFTHFFLGIRIKTVTLETDLVLDKKILESFEMVQKKNTYELPYLYIENFLTRIENAQVEMYTFYTNLLFQ